MYILHKVSSKSYQQFTSKSEIDVQRLFTLVSTSKASTIQYFEYTMFPAYNEHTLITRIIAKQKMKVHMETRYNIHLCSTDVKTTDYRITGFEPAAVTKR